MPMLSIIVPIYQAKKYLEKCIDSILEQSFSDFELILVDDGSDDGSEEICNTYAKNDKRVKIIRQENQGVSTARNTGLDYASGKYIAFVDADDWVEKDLFASCVKAAEESKAEVIYHGMIKEIWLNEEMSTEIKGGQINLGAISKRGMKKYVIDQNGYVEDHVFCYLFLASLIENVRFCVDMSYAEDALFVKRVLDQAKSYCILNNQGYHYNARMGSAAYRWQPEMLQSYKKVLNEEIHFLKNLYLTKQEIDSFMAIKVMNGYASLIYNLCLPTCPLKVKEKMKILKSARKEFRVDFYRKMYKIDANSLFEKVKTVLMIWHMERILIVFGPLYCRRN